MVFLGYTLDWKILLIVVVILAVAIYLAYRLIQLTRQSRKSLDRFLKKHFHEVLPHAALPDAMGGQMFCDYLALNQEGIHVIHYMDYPGILFGGDRIDQWTQVLGSKSFRFENPLFPNRQFMNEITRLTPDAPVNGILVFSDQGSFPRGKPENVFLSREFREHFTRANAHQSLPEKLLQQWENLKNKLYKQ